MGNLVLNGSTSGAVTITPPAVAGTNTLTIPAATGTVLVPTSSGSTGQILTTNGTTPSWVNGWTLINTVTGSSVTALQDTTSLTSTYANYMIVIRNLIPATSAVTTQLQVQTGGSYQTTGYSTEFTMAGAGYNLTNSFQLGYASRVGNTYPAYWVFYMSSPSSTTIYKPFVGQGTFYDITPGPNLYRSCTSSGAWITGTGAITGFQILASSGNISGTVLIYGSN